MLIMDFKSIKIIPEFLNCGILEDRASRTVLVRRTVVWDVWLDVREFALFMV